jgi:hypothetical protein
LAELKILIFVCVGAVMYSGKYDVCNVTLLCPTLGKLKSLPDQWRTLYEILGGRGGLVPKALKIF